MADILFSKIRFLKGLVLRNFWPSLTRIPRVKQPILFIQSLRDEIVPSSQMSSLYTAATGASFKQLVRITPIPPTSNPLPPST